MNKVIKRRWVKALRSGKYEQGVGSLREEFDGSIFYCCLGVLCEVMGERFDSDAGLPSLDSAKKAGLSFDENEDCWSDAKTIVPRLAYFNDDGKSFAWIASYIERYL